MEKKEKKLNVNNKTLKLTFFCVGFISEELSEKAEKSFSECHCCLSIYSVNLEMWTLLMFLTFFGLPCRIRGRKKNKFRKNTPYNCCYWNNREPVRDKPLNTHTIVHH